MKKNIQVSDEKLKYYLDDFYSCFKTGYDFEDFIKTYLEKIGFDEVRVTKRTRDGGIDLKAIRPGIGGLSEADQVHYCIQVKRHLPSKTTSVNYIRQLKGVLDFGYKGMFITTSGKFSKDAIFEAGNDISKMVVLIDGKKLIQSCIDEEIGFVYNPVFSKNNLKKFINDDKVIEHSVGVDINDSVVVNKKITKNDIRARILSIPGDIYNEISHDVKKLDVVINGKVFQVSVIHTRKYFAGVTSIYRELGLLSVDEIYNERLAVWKYESGKISINIDEFK